MRPIQYPVKPPGTTVFQYPSEPRPRLSKAGSAEPAGVLGPKGEEQFVILGLHATDLEWRGWNALLSLGWKSSELGFQVGEFGGRGFLGGVVIDIVVPTRPLWTPVFINGQHWHEGSVAQSDLVDHERLAQELPDVYAPAVEIWQNDLINDDSARWAMLDKVGRA